MGAFGLLSIGDPTNTERKLLGGGKVEIGVSDQTCQHHRS